MKKEIVIVIVVLALGAYFLFGKKKEKSMTIDPDPSPDLKTGCMDSQACNYDPSAEIEEKGDCEYLDECGECGGTGVIDVCGVCDGGETDSAECGGEILTEGEYEFQGRVYLTQIVEYADGTQLEWMTENFKYMNPEDYQQIPTGNTNSACTVYDYANGDSLELAIQKDAYIKYGGLYNHNYMLSMENAPFGDNWRLPTVAEFEGLLNIPDEFGTLFHINDLCSITDWEIGQGGSDESGMDFKGGGYNTSGNAIGKFITEKACYLVEKDGNTRQNVQFDTLDNSFTLVQNTNLGSVRLVRNTAP